MGGVRVKNRKIPRGALHLSYEANGKGTCWVVAPCGVDGAEEVCGLRMKGYPGVLRRSVLRGRGRVMSVHAPSARRRVSTSLTRNCRNQGLEATGCCATDCDANYSRGHWRKGRATVMSIPAPPGKRRVSTSLTLSCRIQGLEATDCYATDCDAN
jgi:hypothetical protein